MSDGSEAEDDGGGGGRGRGPSAAGNNSKKKGRNQFAQPKPKIIAGPAGDAISKNIPYTGPLVPRDAHNAGKQTIQYPGSAEPVFMRRRGITHASGSYVALRRISEGERDPEALSASYMGGGGCGRSFSSSVAAPTSAIDLDGPTATHILWLGLPAAWLEPNPDSLVHFRVATHNDMLRATCMSFVLHALATPIDPSGGNDHEKGVSLMENTFRHSNGRNYHRMEVLVHTILAPEGDDEADWDEMFSRVPTDPARGVPISEFLAKPDVFIMNELTRPTRRVGWLFQYIIYDPKLHPALLFQHEIYFNRLIKAVDPRNTFDGAIESLLYRVSHYLSNANGGTETLSISAPMEITPVVAVTAASPSPTTAAAASDDDEEEEDKDFEGATGAAAGDDEEMKDAASENDAPPAEATAAVEPVADEEQYGASEDSAEEEGDDNERNSSDECEEVDEDEASEDREKRLAAEAIEAEDLMSHAIARADHSRKTREREMAARIGQHIAGGEKTFMAARIQGTTLVLGDADSSSDGGEFNPDEQASMLAAVVEKETTAAESAGVVEPVSQQPSPAAAAAAAEAPPPKRTRTKAPKKTKNDGAHKKERSMKEINAAEASVRARAEALRKQAAAESTTGGATNSFNIALTAGSAAEAQLKKEAERRKASGAAYHAASAARLQAGRRATESIGYLFGRSVLTLPDFSQVVLDTYLRECGADVCQAAKNGLYDRLENLNVEPFNYNMIGPETPLHYAKLFTFTNAMSLLRANMTGRVTPNSPTYSLQWLEEEYVGSVEEPTLRTPYPWFTVAYSPQDTNPERLASYRPPGAQSALDALISETRAREQRHMQAMRSKLEAARKELFEHPRLLNRAPANKRTSEGADKSGTAPVVVLPTNRGDALAVTNAIRETIAPATGITTSTAASLAAAATSTATLMGPPPPRRISTFAVDAQNGTDSMISVPKASPFAHAIGTANRGGGAGSGSGSSLLRRSGTTRGAAPEAQMQRAKKQMEARSSTESMRHLERLRNNVNDLKEADRELIGRVIAEINSMHIDNRAALLKDIMRQGRMVGMAPHYRAVHEIVMRFHAEHGLSGRSQQQRTIGSGTELSGGDLGAAGGAYNEAQQRLVANYGNQTERATSELLVTSVEHSLEKLTARCTERLNELMKLSAEMPFRTEIEVMYQWLNITCGADWKGRVRPVPTEQEATHYGVSLDDLYVLRAMDSVREERFQHDWMCVVMRTFRSECGTEILSSISITNSGLPAAMRGALLWEKKRPEGGIFVHPVLSFDRTLSNFGVGFARDALETAQTRIVNETLLPVLLNGIFVTGRSQLRIDKERLPDALLLHGTPGIAKSQTFRAAQDAVPFAGITPAQYSSRLARVTSDIVQASHTLVYHDEAPAWINEDGSEFQLGRREDRDREKSMFTEQRVSFERQMEGADGTRRRESRIVSFTHNIIALTNRMGAGADIMDRLRYYSSAYVMSRITNGARELSSIDANDARIRMNAQKWRDERWDEYLITMYTEAFIAANVLPRVNTRLFTAVRTAGDASLARWFGPNSLFLSGRQPTRADNQVRQYVVMGAIHRRMRSELSPYMLSMEDDPERPGRKVPRLSLEHPRAFTPEHLITMMPTALCATYDHVLPAYYEYLSTEVLPLHLWRILSVIGYAMLGFTRDYFEPCYARYGIETVDVLHRANQRRVPDSEPFVKRSKCASFIADEYGLLADLTASALQVQQVQSRIGLTSDAIARLRGDQFGGTPRPMFVTAYQLRELFPSATDAAVRSKANAQGGDNPRTPPPPPDLNPSILFRFFNGNDTDVLKQIEGECNRILGGIDVDMLTTAMKLLRRYRIAVPWHRTDSATIISASTLGFEGVTAREGVPVIEDGKPGVTPLLPSEMVGKINWKHVPLMHAGMHQASGKFFIAIPSFALMLPAVDLYYEALTAHEGPNTRACRVILPQGHIEAPTLMHTFEVRPNPNGSNSIHTGARFSSTTSVTAEQIRVPVVLPGDVAARERQRSIREQEVRRSAFIADRAASRLAKSGGGDGGSSTTDVENTVPRELAEDPTEDMDTEMAEFAAHLRHSFFEPSKDTLEKIPTSYETLEQRYAFIAKHLLDAPGHPEEYIRWLWKNCPDLKNGRTGDAPENGHRYPDWGLAQTISQNTYVAAKTRFETNQAHFITDDDWNPFLEMLRKAVTAAQEAADADALDKATLTLQLAIEVREMDISAHQDPALAAADKHHYRAQIHIAYRMWESTVLRRQQGRIARLRRDAIAQNGMTALAEAFAKSEYETVTDMLKYDKTLERPARRFTVAANGMLRPVTAAGVSSAPPPPPPPPPSSPSAQRPPTQPSGSTSDVPSDTDLALKRMREASQRMPSLPAAKPAAAKGAARRGTLKFQLTPREPRTQPATRLDPPQ